MPKDASCLDAQTRSASVVDAGSSNLDESSTDSKNDSAPSAATGGSGRRSSVARKLAVEEEAANALRAGLSDAHKAAAVWKAVAKMYRWRAEGAFARQLELRRELEALRLEGRSDGNR